MDGVSLHKWKTNIVLVQRLYTMMMTVVAVLNVASEEDVYPVNVSIRYNILGWLAATLCDK